MYDFWGEQARKNAPPKRESTRRDGPWWMHRSAHEEHSPNAQIADAMDYIKENYGTGKLTPEEAAVVQASTASAKMVKKAGSCPECGGKNYASLGQVASEHGSFENHQCFDCGYPVRHDGVPGMGSVVTGAGQRARQTNAGGKVINNYHPQNTAAGRLG